METVNAAKRYLDWVRGLALPFWASAGWDAERGGFYEALGHDGRPVPGPRRVRVQSRQIHAFAEAEALGWLPGGRVLADRGFAYVRARACPDGGARGCVHILDEEGRVIDATRDLYDQAFLLLACASLWDEPLARDLAGRTLGFLDRDLAATEGYRERDAGASLRRQNPHMHLFEALLALYEASNDEAFLERAAAIHRLFETRFLDRTRGVVREFFNDDLSPAPGGAGVAIEPGHGAEWVFLLDWFGAARGVDTSADQRLLFAQARASADAAGFLPDVAGADGARRLWPQTEYLRAALLLARAGDASAAAVAPALVDALFESYLDHEIDGLWIDRFDGAGRPIAKDTPASILYHLMSAAREAQRFLESRTP